ncbi:MAG: alpha/beta fold hydrolase [Roseomonas sp.]|nr:alpha/beta fold hydrolase [Roseomonas sp.]MCA3289573.1 alpha/beta fold hydrolase [Roseomonas sp.]MCA3293292.1 alpha/beta fold hydrolase [Roseomonas sp.]
MLLNVMEAGQGPPLVLLHGLFGSARNWGAVQKVLSTDYRVVALDLRNHGASPHAPGMDYAAQAADVAETLATLGIERAVVLGHSMGGKAAMMLALMRPELVSRLIIADIAPRPYPPALRAVVAAMQALPLHAGLTRQEADQALRSAVPEAPIRSFLLQNLRFETAPPSWRIGLAEIAAALPEIEDFAPPPSARFEGPALAMAGALSPYIRTEDHPAFRALFPRISFASIPRAGHWLHAENPEGSLAALKEFLAA